MKCFFFITTLIIYSNIAVASKTQHKASTSALLLVLPIFGDCPAELRLPWAGMVAESLLVILPRGNLKVVVRQPTEPILPGAIEPIARQKGYEIGANAVVWGELISPGDCHASRMIRLWIMDLKTQELYRRQLCPNQVSAEDLARVFALSIADALKDGVVDGIHIPVSKNGRIEKKRIPRVDKKRCTENQPCVCPSLKTSEQPSGSKLGILAGWAFSSHPNWTNPGLGLALGIEWFATDWFGGGLVLEAVRGRRVTVDDVNALYTAWPISLYCRFFGGDGNMRWGVKFGGKLALSRLDVLLERLDSVKTVEKVNPVIFAKATIGIKLGTVIRVELGVGPAVFLRRQKYTYTTLERAESVLWMQPVSIDVELNFIVNIY